MLFTMSYGYPGRGNWKYYPFTLGAAPHQTPEPLSEPAPAPAPERVTEEVGETPHRGFIRRNIGKLLGAAGAFTAATIGLLHEPTRSEIRFRVKSAINQANAQVATNFSGIKPEKALMDSGYQVNVPAALNWNGIEPEEAKAKFSLNVVQGKQPSLQWVDEYDGSIQRAIPDPPRTKVAVQHAQEEQRGKKIEVIEVHFDTKGKCVGVNIRLISANEEKGRYRSSPPPPADAQTSQSHSESASVAASTQRENPPSDTSAESDGPAPQ